MLLIEDRFAGKTCASIGCISAKWDAGAQLMCTANPAAWNGLVVCPVESGPSLELGLGYF
jgi:hypothetical protein